MADIDPVNGGPTGTLNDGAYFDFRISIDLDNLAQGLEYGFPQPFTVTPMGANIPEIQNIIVPDLSGISGPALLCFLNPSAGCMPFEITESATPALLAVAFESVFGAWGISFSHMSASPHDIIVIQFPAEWGNVPQMFLDTSALTGEGVEDLTIITEVDGQRSPLTQRLEVAPYVEIGTQFTISYDGNVSNVMTVGTSTTLTLYDEITNILADDVFLNLISLPGGILNPGSYAEISLSSPGVVEMFEVTIVE